MFVTLLLAASTGPASDDLKQQIQEAMDAIANASGFSFSVGVKDGT